MLENGKISHKQFAILVMMYLIGSSILLLPSALAAKALQDAWISAILGVGVGMVIVILYNSLGSLFPTKTLAEYNEIILGKWLGKFVSLLFFSYFFLISALVLRNIGDFVITYALQDTPIEVIEISLLLVVIMGVHSGLETFSRTSELLIPFVFILLFMIIILISPEVDVLNIQPIFEKGIKPIIGGALPFLGTPCLELVVLLMIFPFVNRNKEAKRAFLVGYLIGGILLIIISLYTILVLGPLITSVEIYPTFILARKINIGHFLERIEMFMAILWMMTIFFKLTICFYATSLCLAQTFNLKEHRYLLLPLGMVMLVLSLVAYPNSAYFLSVIGSIWVPFAFVYGGILPVILLIVSKLRNSPMKKDRLKIKSSKIKDFKI
jgi:spore germination protein KB